ncbi:MAG TPA: PqqD family protein [Trueperaceae bacterium]|nr:PqqD family protein [Trueperaceae bacterium]
MQQEHDLDSTFAVHSDVVLESIEDMMIAVHLGTDRIVELNETASRLLELLMGGATAATAAGMIADEYSAPAGEVLRNVEGTVEALLAEGIIQRGPN